MEKLFAGEISACFYQFHLFDSALDISERLPDWNSENIGIGYISTGRAIYISTVADFNRHWLEVYLSDGMPELTDCERALVFNIKITAGGLDVWTVCYDEEHFDIPSTNYIVYILAYSLGHEEEELLSNDEMEKRMDLERYAIILVAGQTENEGVIKGGKYLPPRPE